MTNYAFVPMQMNLIKKKTTVHCAGLRHLFRVVAEISASDPLLFRTVSSDFV